ncbi:MAG: hypothetical protein IPJ79_15295 [Bacteroidetes bacterium]|nr:hypothetical protein [Bacteroidota bacterium]
MKRINILFKIALASVLVLNGAFFIYANTRTLSVSEKVKPVTLAAYQTDKALTNENLAQLKTNSAQLKNKITAMAATSGNNVIGITYYSDLISSSEIASTLESNNSFDLSEITFQSSGKSCPISGIKAQWNSLLNAYRISDN